MLFSDKALEFTLKPVVVFDCLLRLTATGPRDSETEITVLGSDIDLDDLEYARFKFIGLVGNFQRFEKRPAELNHSMASRVVLAQPGVRAYVDV